MKKRRLVFYLVCVTYWLFATVAWAQLHSNELLGGQNALRKKRKTNWGKIYGAQSDVYYFDDNKALADNSARMLAKAYHELSRFFEYKASTRIQLNLYPAQQDYVTVPNFQFPDLDVKNHVNWFSAYHAGDYTQTYGRIKTEVARCLLNDMFYGGNGVSGLQNRVLLYVPDWYMTGMSYFLGEGWLPEDEAILRSLVQSRTDLIPYIERKNYDRIEIAVKKSIWYFVFRAYGSKKINEIAYMTRLTRSSEGGLVSAVGLRTPSFTVKWLEFCNNTFADERLVFEQQDGIMLTGGRVAGAVLSPSQKLIAYITEKNGVFSLNIYNIAKKKTTNTLYKAGISTNHPALKDLSLPIAWAPDGMRLVFSLPQDEEMPLIYFNLKNNRSTTQSGKFAHINHLDWSPDGKLVVFSASKSGFTDIYISPAEGSSFTPLTFDAFDDLEPCWVNDKIIFASNRDTVTAARSRNIDYHFFENNFDLYTIANPAKERVIKPLTQTPYLNERKPRWVEQKLYALIDTGGIYNLNILDAKDSIFTPLTNHNSGIINYSPIKDKILFLCYDNGKLGAYLSEIPQKKLKILPTTALNYYRDRYRKSLKERQEIITYAEQIKKLKEEPKINERIDTVAIDTAAQITEKPRAFYYFDEDDDHKDKEKRRAIPAFSRNRKKKDKPQAPPPPPFDINAVRLQSAGPYEPTFLLRGVETTIEIDPIFRFNANIRLLIEDPFRYHRLQLGFRPFLDFKSTDASLRYQFLRYRMQYEANFLHTNRFLDTPQTIRHTAYRADVGAQYPLDQFNRLGAFLNFTHIDRTDLLLTDDIDVSAAANLTGAEFRYVFDNTRTEPNFTLKGTKIRVSYNFNYSITNKAAVFSEINFDIRKYIPLPKHIVLAARLSGGAFIGRNRPLYMLGGIDNWLNVNFVNNRDIPILGNTEAFNFTRIISPLRSFGYNVRNGYHYGLGNFELRLPLSRMFQTRLTANAGYNLQWIFFYDIGLAWKTGNPLSSRNPIDALTINRPPLTITVQNLKTPFIMGFGTGVRTTLLGFLVRLDLGWGIDDGSLTSPQFNVALGKDF